MKGSSPRWCSPAWKFSDDTVTEYDREKAKELVAALPGYPGLAFEGHSTDYQTKECLRAMVLDGVRILKVGPALTFAAREGLFALEGIEKELCEGELSNFRGTLEGVMRGDDRYWKKYYHGAPREVAVKLAYSYSDRSRYYMGDRAVQDSARALYKNVNRAKPPLSLLRQYMPAQYDRVRRGESPAKPRRWSAIRCATFWTTTTTPAGSSANPKRSFILAETSIWGRLKGERPFETAPFPALDTNPKHS